MGSNVYLKTRNHERAIHAGVNVSKFVNDCIEKELDRMELEAKGV